MIRSLYHRHDGQVLLDLEPDQLAAALQDKDGLLWLDIGSEPPEACEPLLLDTFGFHPLAVDDALKQSHVPKVDDWGSYVYLVLHGVVLEPADSSQPADVGHQRLDTLELDLFLGPHYLVSYWAHPIAAVDRLWAACQRDERHLHRGAAHLLYELADGLVADYMPVVDRFDTALDHIEKRVFGNPTPQLLERIFRLKRALAHLRRIFAPQREVLNKLARGDYAVVEPGDGIFFRDVYDHLVRLYDINESLRDLVSGALDTYLSVVNNRMNEVVKTLTLITTLFMPVSFLVGFFGMNFFQAVVPLHAWTGRAAFALMLAAMVATPLGMYLWIRKRAWM